MTEPSVLQQECHELEIKLFGKRIELAMAQGLRGEAELWRQRMYQAIQERNRVNVAPTVERAA